MDLPTYDSGSFAADLQTVDPLKLPITLFLAIANGQDDIVLYLTDKVDIHKVTYNGQTPLLAAVDAGQTRVVQRLMDYDCEIDGFGQTRFDGETVSMTPLMKAAEKGHLVLVKLLIEVYHADDSLVSPEGLTALRLAVKGGHREIVQYLPTRRGGEWRRLKFRNRRSIRRIKRTARFFYSAGECMVGAGKALVWDFPQWIAKMLWRMVKKIPDFTRKLPGRLQRLALKVFDLVKRVPGWTVRVVRWLWKTLAKVPPAVWRFVTVIAPEAVARFSKWLLNVAIRFGKAVASIVGRAASVVHTALASLFSMATLQDIINGFKQLLHALSPAKIWHALGQTWKGFVTFLEWCVKGSAIVVQCIVFAPVVLLMLMWELTKWLSKKIVAIPASLGAMAARTADEVHVWVNPKAGI